jgi:hypothetical protein
MNAIILRKEFEDESYVALVPCNHPEWEWVHYELNPYNEPNTTGAMPIDTSSPLDPQMVDALNRYIGFVVIAGSDALEQFGFTSREDEDGYERLIRYDG